MALLFTSLVPQPPRATGLLMLKEVSGFAEFSCRRSGDTRQDQLLPVPQAGATPAHQGLPNCSSSQLRSPGIILAPALLKGGGCSGHCYHCNHNSMMKVLPIGIILSSFKYQQPQIASHASSKEPSISS